MLSVYPKAMITSANADSDLLMWAVSCAAVPVALDSARHSEPARSTNDSLDRRGGVPAPRSSAATWSVTMLGHGEPSYEYAEYR